MDTDNIPSFMTGLLIGIGGCLVVCLLAIEGEDVQFNSRLCKQLYSNTSKYLECTTKSRFEIIKVIKGID